MLKELPPHPHLDRLKQEAKDLLKAHEAADPAALRRIKAHPPQWAQRSDEAVLNETGFALRDAQLVIAWEYGFGTWKELVAAVQPAAAEKVAPAAQSVFIGNSPAVRRVLDQVAQVAQTDAAVLLCGETGTGKGLAAHAIHRMSTRRSQPFIYVSCGTVPDYRVECELFGHEGGAYAEVVQRGIGKVELARGGTLFLDEVGDASVLVQTKLLVLLTERTFERVGGRQTLNAEARIIVATSRDLAQMVEAVTFRQDLYRWLQGVKINLPPLRQRREDIPLLARHFIRLQAANLHKKVEGLSAAAEAALLAYKWTGNVRELERAVSRAVLVCDGPTVQADDLSLGL